MKNNLKTNIITYVNDKEVTEEEFKQLKESIEKNKDVQLVEVAPNKYKTRLFG